MGRSAGRVDEIRTTREARRKAGRCRQCGEPSVTGSFCEPHRQAHNAQKARAKLTVSPLGHVAPPAMKRPSPTLAAVEGVEAREQ